MRKAKLLVTGFILAGWAWIFVAANRKKEPLAKKPAKEKSPATIYRGNPGSRVFHLPACKYYNAASCVEAFATREEAVGAEFRPCGLCAP